MKTAILLTLLLVFSFAGSNLTYSQHSDVLLQNLNSRLTSGSASFETNSWSLGQQVYEGELDSIFTTTEPGWNALAAGSPDMPAGATALPANTNLEWDFLPMKIDGTLANLFYWDGTGSVAFGNLPTAGYALSLQAMSGNFISVSGTPDLVAGETIATTDSSGGIHQHRFWFLDDGDANPATDPAEGLYLAALRTRIEGLDRSNPMFFLFGTPNSDHEAIESAEEWVDQQVDLLTPDFSADFDSDLEVDGHDFLTLQQHLGTTGSNALQQLGDADYNNTIDQADLAIWSQQLGSSPHTFPGAFSPPSPAQVATIPEPSTILLLTLGTCSLLANRSRRPSQELPIRANTKT